jgi:hypothetical protein
MGSTMSHGRLVNFAGGKENVLRDLGTVYEDDCGGGAGIGTERSAVFFLPVRDLATLYRRVYAEPCGSHKAWKEVSGDELPMPPAPEQNPSPGDPEVPPGGEKLPNGMIYLADGSFWGCTGGGNWCVPPMGE